MSKLIKITLGLAAATALGATAQAECRVATPPTPSCVSCDGPRTGTSTLPPLSSYFQHQARCGLTVSQGHVVNSTASVAPHVSGSSYALATAFASSSASASATASANASATANGYATAHANASTYAYGSGSASANASAYAYGSGAASANASASASTQTTSYAAPVTTAYSQSQASASAQAGVTSNYQQNQYGIERFSGTYGGLGSNESLRPTTCPVAVHNPGGNAVLGCYNVVKQWTPPTVHYQHHQGYQYQYHRPAPRPIAYRVVRPIIYVRYPVPVCVTGCPPQRHHRSRYGS